jgi:hypothetical protein
MSCPGYRMEKFLSTGFTVPGNSLLYAYDIINFSCMYYLNSKPPADKIINKITPIVARGGLSMGNIGIEWLSGMFFLISPVSLSDSKRLPLSFLQEREIYYFTQISAVMLQGVEKVPVLRLLRIGNAGWGHKQPRSEWGEVTFGI